MESEGLAETPVQIRSSTCVFASMQGCHAMPAMPGCFRGMAALHACLQIKYTCGQSPEAYGPRLANDLQLEYHSPVLDAELLHSRLLTNPQCLWSVCLCKKKLWSLLLHNQSIIESMY